ncbi:MAG: peptide chain release factor 4 [Rothia sp. (in: high G+C Gram-positive bacteria)]|uniref:peptide chain release factor 4 n=1 Tax=Rothia sp. (in: high G+C Gram-positive bacteria) TaxID=1885016 RepID=UPI0026DC0DF3|nr:peptide chain release factor 4 [Rothia sp. (in: high G+C Gram-positive bacteria)]MDO4884157.1 peptide chain release factor 4 [Rothia sp. (in: high G+C Gram-positive bacteria)]
MGILRSALLLGAGAAVGYLASRRAAYVKANPSSASLIKYQSGALELNPESQMGKFFDSSLGKPLQPYALRAVEFAARVRQGMQEKEAELHAKVERQKQDARPGSLDLWDRDMSPNEASELRRAVAERELIEVESEIAHLEEARQARLHRDRELGEDFFN